jgi:hypothetical protein
MSIKGRDIRSKLKLLLMPCFLCFSLDSASTRLLTWILSCSRHRLNLHTVLMTLTLQLFRLNQHAATLLLVATFSLLSPAQRGALAVRRGVPAGNDKPIGAATFLSLSSTNTWGTSAVPGLGGTLLHGDHTTTGD